MTRFDGAAIVAGVVGRPIAHSLSPTIHRAWIEDLGLNAAYVPFRPAEDGFERLVRALRGGVVRGLNVTAPFKEAALALSTEADEAAVRCGSANVLLFDADGAVRARSTDGHGLIAAFVEQAPDARLRSGVVAVLGAGGAARAAVASVLGAGAAEVRIFNRSADRAYDLAVQFGKVAGTQISAHGLGDAEALFRDVDIVINAAAGGPLPPIDRVPAHATVMDMTYRPVVTGLLAAARHRGLRTVDGLSMLIHQAAPSFAAFYDRDPPAGVDVRALCLAQMDAFG